MSHQTSAHKECKQALNGPVWHHETPQGLRTRRVGRPRQLKVTARKRIQKSAESRPKHSAEELAHRERTLPMLEGRGTVASVDSEPRTDGDP